MRHTTSYLTAISILTLLGTGLTPASAADAPEVPASPVLESDIEAPIADTAEDADAVIAYPAPPVDLMDRTTWPAIVVTPADGKVTHNPTFMGEVPMGEDIVSPLHAPDPVWQIQEALRGEEAGNLNGENLSALAAQPVIATAQIIAMPFRAILDNPLSKETSPK